MWEESKVLVREKELYILARNTRVTSRDSHHCHAAAEEAPCIGHHQCIGTEAGGSAAEAHICGPGLALQAKFVGFFSFLVDSKTKLRLQNSGATDPSLFILLVPPISYVCPCGEKSSTQPFARPGFSTAVPLPSTAHHSW